MVASAPTDAARVDRLLIAARDTIAGVPFCWAITPSEDGGINARLVGPILGAPGDEDWTIWFSTSRSSRKAADVRRAGRLTLGYQHHPDQSYVVLVGRATLFEDRLEIRRRWLESWRLYFPGGPDDPDLVFIRINVDRIELCVQGVTAEPFGSRYSVVERDGERRWKVISD
jgi:general stress protein 26